MFNSRFLDLIEINMAYLILLINIVNTYMSSLYNFQSHFQMGIQTMDLVEDIVRLFKKSNTQLTMLCALAIFRVRNAYIYYLCKIC